jgi:hypothetical protein
VPPSVAGVKRAPISMSCELAGGRSREGGRTRDVAYYNSNMAMGKRKRDRQPTMWVATTELPIAVSHPFYRRLNQLLREHGFDDFAEAQCATFYAETRM